MLRPYLIGAFSYVDFRVLGIQPIPSPCSFSQMKQVVGMLAEQESAGVVGEGQAGELRDALVGIREMLRAETDAAAPQHEEPATTALGEDAAQAKVRSVLAIVFR